MTGAILNAAGIVGGGLAGLLVLRKRPFKPATEAFFKVALGVATIFFGLRLAWLNLEGSAGRILKQLAIAALAIVLGKLLGRLLHLQKMSNRLGRHALHLMQNSKGSGLQRFNSGFLSCAILFCAAPLGILGAVQDGLSGYFQPLVVKAVMDGLAMAGFVTLLGWGSMLSALPVFVLQAAIALACNVYAEPFLRVHGILECVNFVGGLLVCTVGLVIFDFKKVELADFLPTLAVAPLLTWLWK